MNLVQLMSLEERSQHNCAAATGPKMTLQLCPGRLCQCFSQAMRLPAGIFYPKAWRLSLQQQWERTPRVWAAKLCFHCPCKNVQTSNIFLRFSTTT